MAWVQDFLDEAKTDMKSLDWSVRARVHKVLDRVAENPLPQSEGGYDKPLRNQDELDLSGMLKVKLKRDGVRIVYKLEREGERMKIVVVGVRADKDVYRKAALRKQRHEL